MSYAEIFHRQLINSYVKSVAVGRFEEFMVRSELLRRTKEITQGYSSPSEIAKATAGIFFRGDGNAYSEMLKKSRDYDPQHIYPIEAFPFGDTTLKSVDFE